MMILLLGLGGVKPPMHDETFQYLNTLVLRPIIALAESIFYHPLFSPYWIILCLAPL